MTRLSRALALTAFLSSAVQAQFGGGGGNSPANQIPECRACMDDAQQSCPNNTDSYDPDFAECICEGVGAEKLMACVSVCDEADTARTGAVQEVISAAMGFCTAWYPSLCPESKQFIDEDLWEKLCGPGSPGVDEDSLVGGGDEDDDDDDDDDDVPTTGSGFGEDKKDDDDKEDGEGQQRQQGPIPGRNAASGLSTSIGMLGVMAGLGVVAATLL